MMSKQNPKTEKKQHQDAAAAARVFWRPDWKWHLRALGIIYAGLVVVYFALSAFLSRVPEPYRMRDIPKEMTPWLDR